MRFRKIAKSMTDSLGFDNSPQKNDFNLDLVENQKSS